MRAGEFRIAECIVNPRMNTVSCNGVTVRLEPKVMDVLVCLSQHAGEPVAKEDLLQTVWPDTFVTDDVLKRSISELRRAFDDDAHESRVIQTIAKRGYRLMLMVQPIGESSDERIQLHESGPEPTPRRVFRQQSESIDSLAVLPFANATPDANNDYLSEGITEEIINNLSKVPTLRVVPRNTAFRYKDKQSDLMRISRELGVKAVLTGRVMQRAEILTVSVELVDVSRESQLWGQRYNHKIADLVLVQEQIATQICETLRPKLTDEQRRRLLRRQTQSREAYEFYLKGRYHWSRRTPSHLTRAIDYFEQATSKDPRYALAHAGIAEAAILLGWFHVFAPRDALERGKSAALKAIECDTELAEGYTALGFVLGGERDWAGAEAALRRAIQINPDYWLAHAWYGLCLTAMGRSGEAVAAARRALEIDPLSLVLHHHAAWVYYHARRFESAIEICQKALEMEPSYGLCWCWMGLAYTELARHEEAITALRRAVTDLQRVPFIVGFLGHAYGRSGDGDGATRCLQEIESSSHTFYRDPYQLALIHLGLKEPERACRYLEDAYHDGSLFLAMWAKTDPRLDPLRCNLRFNDLLSRLGLCS